MTKGTPGSEIIYMSVNPNGEAEVLKVYFRPRPRLKKLIQDLDFSQLAIKGRSSQGNLYTRYGIQKIVLKEQGTSTLGGQNIWFDDEVLKLNTDARGQLLGEFSGADKIIVFTRRGQYYTTGYDTGHHFPEDTVRVEKYDPSRIYSVAYFDGTSRYYYLKRFATESSERMQPLVDEDSPGSRFEALSGHPAPLLELIFGGDHKTRPVENVDVNEFIGVKSHRAKGKRLSTYQVAKLRFIEPELPDSLQPDEPRGDDGPGTKNENHLPQGQPLVEPAPVNPDADAAGTEFTDHAGDIEFTIERPLGDDETDPTPQLDLF